MPELIVDTKDGFTFAALVDGKTMIDLAIDRAGETRLYHSLWRVKIDRIVPGVGAFTTIGARSGLFRDATRTSGDHVIAQVKSIRREGKADIVTDDVSLGGAYFVLLPKGDKLRVSRKIDPALAAPVIAALEEAGIGSGIVRTTALTAPLSDVIAEAQRLEADWKTLEKSTAAGLLRQGPSAPERLIQDYPQHRLSPRFERFEDRGIAEQLEALRRKHIPLSSGGSIVIERTAALTAIDVNAGTAAPASVDREAIEMIALGLRLRNLSGLIVIDFCSSAAKEKPDTLLEPLRRAISTDPAGARVVGISPSGLVEIVRPARDLPLEEKLATLA